MPKKTRSKFKTFKVAANQYGHIYSNSRAVVDGTDPTTTLNYLIEIFSNRLDKDVVKLVVDECEFNVDQAFETLLSLCNDENVEALKNDEKLKKSDEMCSMLPHINYNDISSDSSATESSMISELLCTPKSSTSFLAENLAINNSFTNEQTVIQDFKQNFYFPQNFSASSDNLSFQQLTSAGNHFNSATCLAASNNVHYISANDAKFMSYPCENLKNAEPTFIVPSLPMPGNISPHKSPGIEANRGFWNVSDFKHFSTFTTENQSSKKHKFSVKETTEKIKLGNRILVIVRGLPGSGKSTLAHKLKFSGVVFSTDDFFFIRGKYMFDPSKLSEAHEWNKNRTKEALEKGKSPVIIDNTNVETWEIKPYVLMGKKYNYEIIILEPDTPWKFNVNELSKRNKHGVPKSTIAKMKDRYENNITVEKILASRDLFPSKDEVDHVEDNACCKITENTENDVKDKHISLKAIIHTEDNSSAINSSLLKNNSLLPLEKVDDECESQNKNLHCDTTDFSSENSATSYDIAICSIDKLRALTRNDSEDTSSYSSSNGSLQEITCWEAITERDDDFQWNASVEELNANRICKSNSSDHLSLKESSNSIYIQETSSSSNSSNENVSSNVEESSFTDKSSENISDSVVESFNSHVEKEIELPKQEIVSVVKIDQSLDSETSNHVFHNYQMSNIQINESNNKPLCFNDSNYEDKLCSDFKELEITEMEIKQLNTPSLNTCEEALLNTEDENENLFFRAKPQRSNTDDLISSKNSFNTQLHESEKLEDLEWSSDWNTPCKQTEESVIKNHSEVELSTPKPQREIFKNKYFSEINTDKCKNDLNASKSILNISLDSIGSDWEFPSYVHTDDHWGKKNGGKKPLAFKMSTQSQTEPRDFDFVYKISFGDNVVNSCNYNVISAKPFDISMTIDDLKQSNDLETYSYQQVASFDKSTSTEDMVDDVEISQKLAHLKECFPDISKDDLLHLLEICYNDEKWISNLLLDWGYKYNFPTENSSDCKIKDDDKREGDENYKIVESQTYKSHSQIDIEKVSVDSSSDTDNQSAKSLEEESKVESTWLKETKLQLVLDSAFAHQLQVLFGPVSLDSGNRQVDIDLELAQLIHEKWKSTVRHSKQIAEEEPKSKNLRHSKRKNKRRNFRIQEFTESYKEPSSLSEIMDMEYALQLHKEEKLKKIDDFSTKVKRLELYNMFPGADTIALDEIFESNNYSLKDSLYALGVDNAQEENIVKKQNAEKMDACVNEWKSSNIFQEFENGDWSDWVYKTDDIQEEVPVHGIFSVPMSAEATELRETAARHHQLRQEYISKAQAAYCRGMKDVASFYAQKGTEEARIAKSKNRLASALIAEEKNFLNSSSKLDLHGLHTQEAISILEKFLRDKKLDLRRRQQSPPFIVTVITGRGVHSLQGAKLRPAVLNYLKSMGYGFTEIKAGHIEVTVMSE